MKLLFVVTLVLHNQLATPQVLRQPQFNFRPIGEKMIETGNFIKPTPTAISEPCNNIMPIRKVAPTPSTTIITDCSPEICQNLANTIQLMIVSNLLQNSLSSDTARQLATPILNEIMSSPVLSCGCNNPFSPNVISPSIISPNIPNPIVSPNIIPNYIAPNIVGPNIYTPNLANPSFVAPAPSVISPNMLPSPPRVVAPTSPCSNLPEAGPDVNGLLNTIMTMLGNIQAKI